MRAAELLGSRVSERRRRGVGNVTRRALRTCLQLEGNALAGEAACKFALALRVGAVLPGEQGDDKERPERHGQKGGACVFDL